MWRPEQMQCGVLTSHIVVLVQKDIAEGAGNLLRVSAHVDADRHGAPAFLAVITGWGYAYRREDGVFVVPIGAFAA